MPGKRCPRRRSREGPFLFVGTPASEPQLLAKSLSISMQIQGGNLRYMSKATAAVSTKLSRELPSVNRG
jgi:hypothetical protein